jgi:hypothetical protein
VTHARSIEATQDDAAGTSADQAGAPAAPPRVGRRLVAAVLVAVNLPIAVATVRALARGWQPVGDDGILLVRARDVGTSHHPLLGTWTSASLVVGDNVNNPGPLYLDALAPVLRLLGPWVGLAVGVMLLNMAASSLAVVAARRLDGSRSMVAVALAVVGLQFAMGSELLFDVWQPNALVLPFLAFLVVVSVLAAGDMGMAPWVMGLGSLLVQTHMSHAVLVGVLSLTGLGACAWTAWRADEPVAWRRPALWSVVVVVLTWCQPLVEQFTGRGEGNLSRIVTAAAAGEGDAIGWARAARVVSEVAAGSPWFSRGSYDHTLATAPGGPDPFDAALAVGPAVVVLATALLALVSIAVWAWSTDRPGVAAMAGMASVAVPAAVVAVATSPRNPIGAAAHQMRWVWPVMAFATAAAVVAGFSALRARSATRHTAVMTGAALALAVAVANLPTHPSQAAGPAMSADALPAARRLVGDLGDLQGRGTVLFDPATLLFAEPYSGLVFAEMQDRGITFVFDDEGFIRQFGEARRNDGSADLRLWQVEGPDALVVPAGAERIGLAEGPSGPVALFVEPIG